MEEKTGKGERQDKGRRCCKQTPRLSFVDVRGSLGPRMNDYFLKQSSTERRHKLQYEKPLTGESVTAKSRPHKPLNEAYHLLDKSKWELEDLMLNQYKFPWPAKASLSQ